MPGASRQTLLCPCCRERPWPEATLGFHTTTGLFLPAAASGRVYAAYGAVSVAVALLWLRLMDGTPLNSRDLLGSVVILNGMGILMGKAPP